MKQRLNFKSSMSDLKLIGGFAISVYKQIIMGMQGLMVTVLPTSLQSEKTISPEDLLFETNNINITIMYMVSNCHMS